MSKAPQKAFFLDRDGVLIEEAHYLKEPERVKLIPGAAAALRRVRETGFLVIVVSNQSGVARGYFDQADIRLVEARINELLAAEGALVDAYYYCPHHPSKGIIPEYVRDCECRKPNPGMLLKAAKDFDIDLSASYMIGDKFSDLGAGKAAGCLKSVLVKTGHGADELGKRGNPPPETPVLDDLPAAIAFLLS